MDSNQRRTWAGIGYDAYALGWDTAAVIGLRFMKLAAGGRPALREAQQMISEKVEATAHLQAAFLTGALGLSPKACAKNFIAFGSAKVRANRRRLSSARRNR